MYERKDDVPEEIISVQESTDENIPMDLSNIHGPLVPMSNKYLTGPLANYNYTNDILLKSICGRGLNLKKYWIL